MYIDNNEYKNIMDYINDSVFKDKVYLFSILNEDNSNLLKWYIHTNKIIFPKLDFYSDIECGQYNISIYNDNKQKPIFAWSADDNGKIYFSKKLLELFGAKRLCRVLKEPHNFSIRLKSYDMTYIEFFDLIIAKYGINKS